MDSSFMICLEETKTNKNKQKGEVDE